MKINNILFLLLLCSFTSCSKWIDVKPTDRLSENQLFSSKEGYLKALNGIYVDMSNPDLYGKFMSVSAIDALANYYVINSSTNSYYEYSMFNYSSTTTKNGFEGVWKKAYELIANSNVILEKCGDAPSSTLPAPYYHIVKGEALALRAMLHLDLLRLFGPIWSETNKSKLCIPYSTSARTEVSPLLTADQVMMHILQDLTAARDLLQDRDPIQTEGVRNNANPAGSNDLFYRQYRLNYFAVQTLITRAYLWKGDKDNAYNLAKTVIAEAQNTSKIIFPFVSAAAANHVQRPDRLFSTEVIFALYTVNKKKLYEDVFAANQLPQFRLSFNAGNSDMSRVNALYEDKNDYRFRIWENISIQGSTLLTNQKYLEIPDAPGRFMIPLIRLSELYLIAAECSYDLSDAKTYLNKLRTARNIVSVNVASSDLLQTAITEEYRKEFIGEGQLFFYFKRNALQTIPNNAAVTGTKTMTLSNYTVPLPDSEISQRRDTIK